jgi:hypothetical protein
LDRGKLRNSQLSKAARIQPVKYHAPRASKTAFGAFFHWRMLWSCRTGPSVKDLVQILSRTCSIDTRVFQKSVKHLRYSFDTITASKLSRCPHIEHVRPAVSTVVLAVTRSYWPLVRDISTPINRQRRMLDAASDAELIPSSFCRIMSARHKHQSGIVWRNG